MMFVLVVVAAVQVEMVLLVIPITM